MADEPEAESFLDKYDWLWVIGGSIFTLIAVVAIKYILDDKIGAPNCFHDVPKLIPIKREVESLYVTDGEGKLRRR